MLFSGVALVIVLRHSERGRGNSSTRGEKVPLNFCDTCGEFAEFSFSLLPNSSITGSASLQFLRKATVVGAGLAANGGKGARGRGGVGRKDAARRPHEPGRSSGRAPRPQGAAVGRTARQCWAQNQHSCV